MTSTEKGADEKEKEEFDDWTEYPTQQVEPVLASSNKWLQFYFDKVKTFTGKNALTGENEFIEHGYNRIVMNNGIKGTVIVPMNKNKEIGLIHIFRYPVYSWSWEFPRGMGNSESDETDPSINAKKELAEEMNVRIPKGDKMIYLGDIFENSGICAGLARVYLALNVMPLPTNPNEIKNNKNENNNNNNPKNSNNNDNNSKPQSDNNDTEKKKDETNETVTINNNNNINQTKTENEKIVAMEATVTLNTTTNNNDNENVKDEKNILLYRRDSVVKLVEKEDVERIKKHLFVSYKEFQNMVKNGLIRDSLTLSAIQMAFCYDNTLFQ